jgi:gamma-glutamylputrescine oxidase
MIEHANSYYAATAHPSPARPQLAGQETADVCVVGGGIAGCSAALELAQRGYRVVLLEGARIAWGASGRSGGQAIVGFGTSQQQLVKLVGLQTARSLWDMSVEALDLLRERVARHAIDCDLAWGHLHVATKPRQREQLLEERRELEELYGYRTTTFMEREEVESLLATRRYCAGLYDPGSGHLHPLNYTLGLGAAAEAAGVRIFEGSAVKRLEPGDPARVHAAGGTVTARHVVLAGGPYIRGVTPATDRRIMPVGTYVVATEPLGEQRMAGLIRRNVAVSHMNFVLDYFRPSADHRVLFGGRVSYSGLDTVDTGRATRARMLRVFPQLADARIEFVWGGFVDISMNRAPDFGRVAPNVYYLQGFSGHGVALAGMAGRLAAEAVAGQAERFDLFGRIGHRDFPGGRLLRTPALVLGMLWYRLRDLL